MTWCSGAEPAVSNSFKTLLSPKYHLYEYIYWNIYSRSTDGNALKKQKNLSSYKTVATRPQIKKNPTPKLVVIMVEQHWSFEQHASAETSPEDRFTAVVPALKLDCNIGAAHFQCRQSAG